MSISSIGRGSASLVFIILILIGFPAHSQELDINGFVDSYHAMRMEEPNDYLASRTRLRLEGTSYIGDANMVVSVNAIDNNVLPNQNGFHLREAYVEYFANQWDLRLGKQIIVWGNADGIRITDVISPEDMTEFLSQDFDDTRIPVDALKFRCLLSKGNIELLWLPIFEPGIAPTGDNPWAVDPNLPQKVTIGFDATENPAKTIENSELAARLSVYMSGIDFGASAIYTRDDFPVMNTHYFSDSDSVHIVPEYFRHSIFGFEFSKPISDIVIRGEAAVYKDKHYETDFYTDGTACMHAIHWLIGIDWYAANNWTVMGQFTDRFILDYKETIRQEEHSFITTLRISKTLMREQLTLETMAYVDLKENAVFNQLSAEYALTDELKIKIGSDLFIGDEGQLGQYEDNSQVWIKGKYSF